MKSIMTDIQFAPLNSILLFILNILPVEYSDEYPAGWYLILAGIHKLKGEDLELIYAFTRKFHEDIGAELVSREFKYSSLQSVIDAA